MNKVIVLYNWQVMDPVRGKPYTTRYKATEATIRVKHPEAVAVEGSREERVIDDDPHSLSTSAFLHDEWKVGRNVKP